MSSRNALLAELATREAVAGIVAYARGHPRLSYWEEAFLADWARRLDAPIGGFPVSERQRLKLEEIAEKASADPLEVEDEAAEDEVEADVGE